jgi:glycogen(starch) synthase
MSGSRPQKAPPLVSRIALIASAYAPTLGGVQELTRHLALSLTSAGDVVEVWTQQADGVDSSVESIDDLTVRRFPFPLPRAQLTSALPFAGAAVATLRALRRAVAEFRPDILHIQCFGPNGAYATALSRLTGVPLVLTLQGETMMDDSDIFEMSLSLRTALRLGLRRAVEVTACSQYTLDDAHARFGLAPGRGEVIFNGVLIDHAPTPRWPAGAGIPDGRYVLALGRVVEKKGFDLLIRAFATIASGQSDVVLAIGGDGPFEPVLRSLAADLLVADRVSFLGRLSRADVARAMDHAEVFVMPSRLEPFGIVVLEAWRAGRAVIATSRGGAPEFVVDGITGLLVDPFDINALAAAIDKVLSDPDLGRALGEAARIRVEDFDWPAIAERYRVGYAAVLGRSRRP